MRRIHAFAGFALLLALFALNLPAADSVRWHRDTEVLDVDLNNAQLIPTLEDLAQQTGWHIFLEPSDKTFTTKFSGLPKGQAMRTLIGDMNYAFVPDQNGPLRLFIFRTSRTAATYEIKANPSIEFIKPNLRKVPNQLVVRLRPGASIEELAKKLGAKVKGRIGDLNAYLLEFDNETALEAARKELATNDDVQSTDYNYYVDAPPAPVKLDSSPIGPPQLSLNPPSGDGKVVVGLVDTAVQKGSLPPELQKFLLDQISVAGDASLDGELKHGTSMAETILRALQAATGGSTSVQILPADAFGANANANTFDIAKAIIAVVNGGANIVNLSLGSDTGSPFLQQVISDVTGRKIVVFAAAGNTHVSTPFYPAAYSGVIAVTAANQPGQLASYANYAPYVSVLAPGNSIVTFNGQSWLVSGTSPASAYAAGVAAGIADTKGVSPSSAAGTVQTSMPFNGGTGK